MVVESVKSSSRDSTPGSLHVLHVADTDACQRFGRMYRELGLALSGEGLRVSLLTDDARTAAALDGTPMEDCLVASLSRWSRRRNREYLRSRFHDTLSAIHLWTTNCLRAARDWAVEFDVPLLIHCTSVTDVERLEARGLAPNEQLLAVCERFEQTLRERWPTLTHAIHLSTPAILHRARPDAERGARPSTLGLLWTGRMDAASGLPTLLDAIAGVRRKQVDLHLVLIGSGRDSRSTWRMVRAKKLQHDVTLIDVRGIWDQALLGADILVLPACERDISLAAPLAMSRGKIVIASRDQLPEWFIEDETALLFSEGDAEELAYHITRSAAGHPSIRAMGRAGSAYARQEFSLASRAAELAQLYRGACSAASTSSATGGA